MFVIRFAFYFTLSFAILCVPIGGGRQLFDKLFSLVTPYAREVVKTTKQKITTTKRYSKKLYSNSTPAVEEDEVKSKMSSVSRRKKTIKKENKDPDETYTDEEQERLRKVLSEE
jgi:hypothetical protein